MMTRAFPRFALATLFLTTLPALSQATATPTPDPWKSLAFLEGTWQASAKGATGASALGSYTFRRELDGHILARHSRTADCKGPANFDCEHGDLLYIYAEAPGTPLKAIYFDSEGHVIHYAVTTPDPTTAIFLSDPAVPGPQFRLVYTRDATTLSGKFQMHMPGQTAWNSYLEWTGPKQ